MLKYVFYCLLIIASGKPEEEKRKHISKSRLVYGCSTTLYSTQLFLLQARAWESPTVRSPRNSANASFCLIEEPALQRKQPMEGNTPIS